MGILNYYNMKQYMYITIFKGAELIYDIFRCIRIVFIEIIQDGGYFYVTQNYFFGIYAVYSKVGNLK